MLLSQTVVLDALTTLNGSLVLASGFMSRHVGEASDDTTNIEQTELPQGVHEEPVSAAAAQSSAEQPSAHVTLHYKGLSRWDNADKSGLLNWKHHHEYQHSVSLF